MSKIVVAMNEMERRTHGVFTACMWALSYPGRVHTLPPVAGGFFEAIGETLLDLETSYYTPDPDLARKLAWTGAQSLPPEAARYQFYPILTPVDLELVKTAPSGSYEYPDDSATLIVGCTLGFGPERRWRGPGIKGELSVSVGGLPDQFWATRRQVLSYPLGWDVLLVDGGRVVGLPRGTAAEVL